MHIGNYIILFNLIRYYCNIGPIYIYIFNYEVGPKDTNLVRSLSELTEHSRFKNLELTGKYQSIVIFVYGIEKFNIEQTAEQLVRIYGQIAQKCKDHDA